MNDTKYCDGYCLIDFGDSAFAEIARNSGHIPEEIVIPSSFNGHPVTGVGFPKFYIERFKRLVLPETVKQFRFAFGYDYVMTIPDITLEIDERNPYFYCRDNVVFSRDGSALVLHFSNEESYMIPRGVKRVSDFAFLGNSKLKSVTLPDGLEEIGVLSFMYCTEIERLVLPDTVRRIGEGAFYGMTGLSEINIPEGIEKLGVNTFGSCGSLVSLRIPASVKSISDSAFPSAYCGCMPKTRERSRLREIAVDGKNEHFVFKEGMLLSKDERCLIYALGEPPDGRFVIPDGIRQVSSGAFDGTVNVSDIVFPDSLDEIGVYAFWNMNDLKKVDLSSVEKIGDMAFTGCSALREVVFSDRLRSIGGSAFNFVPIKKAVLPGSLESFGHGALSGCRELVINDDMLHLFVKVFDRHNAKIVLSVCSHETGELLYKLQICEENIDLFDSECEKGLPELSVFDQRAAYMYSGYYLNYYEEDHCPDNVISYMLLRLFYPYRLEDEYGGKFREYLNCQMRYIIEKLYENGNYAVIDKMTVFGVISENNFNGIMDIALELDHVELTAYLLELKNRHFPNTAQYPELQ